MNTPNESERLVKKYFWFLVENHGFEYDELYTFRSIKMLVKVLPGHKTPRIDIIKIGVDPDLFKLNFEWIIKFFRGAFPSDNHDYLKYDLETNMVFISKIFQENSHKLIDEFDDWWLPVHVFQYRTVEEEYRNKGQADRFLKAYNYYHDYLKNEGVI
jgi:hypothetical protein